MNLIPLLMLAIVVQGLPYKRQIVEEDQVFLGEDDD